MELRQIVGDGDGDGSGGCGFVRRRGWMGKGSRDLFAISIFVVALFAKCGGQLTPVSRMYLYLYRPCMFSLSFNTGTFDQKKKKVGLNKSDSEDVDDEEEEEESDGYDSPPMVCHHLQ